MLLVGYFDHDDLVFAGKIGTGSGYQSAYLSNLTDKVWTIEIIKPLAERTRGIYDDLQQMEIDQRDTLASIEKLREGSRRLLEFIASRVTTPMTP